MIEAMLIISSYWAYAGAASSILDTRLYPSMQECIAAMNDERDRYLEMERPYYVGYHSERLVIIDRADGGVMILCEGGK